MKGKSKNGEKWNLRNIIVWSKKSGSKKTPTHRGDEESKSDKWEAKKYHKKNFIDLAGKHATT